MKCVRAKWDVLRLTPPGKFVNARDARLVPWPLEPKDNPPLPCKKACPPQPKVKKRGGEGKENEQVRERSAC